MSLEHSPARQVGASFDSGDPAQPNPNMAFWYSYIDEIEAADFLGFEPRTMQAHRQRGGGPQYHALSSRCLRYRRIDLKAWADARIRKSTADQGEAA